MKNKKQMGKSDFPLKNSIIGYFKANGFDRITARHFEAFIEVMAEERGLPQWIVQQGPDLAMKVLARAQAKKQQQKPKANTVTNDASDDAGVSR